MKSDPLYVVEAKYSTVSTKARIVGWLVEIDSLCGGGTDANVLPMLAQMILVEYRGRTVGTLLLALRHGMSVSGTVGHKLTWPRICEWMRGAEKMIEEHNHNEYIRNK